MSGVGDQFEVESIVDSKVRYRKQLYLVRWKGFGPKHDSWEPEEHLTQCQNLIAAFNASQRQSRPKSPGRPSMSRNRSPARIATPRKQSPSRIVAPRKQSPSRTKAPVKTPSKAADKVPETKKKAENAERIKLFVDNDEQESRISDIEWPEEIPTPMPEKISQTISTMEESIKLTSNGIIMQRSSLHGQLKSPVTMRKENGRYPTVSEMRDLAVQRSKAKLGLKEDGEEFSDADDENDGPHPKSTRFPRWSRNLMACALGVVGLGVCVWTTLVTLPPVEEVQATT